MLDLSPIIERISALLAQGTDASVTYAALEARLALENVAYDRLRHRHDYISHAQLKRWQPGNILTTLLTEVDDATTSTVTLKITAQPVDKADGIEIGSELGFDAKRLAGMWQALANLALHIRLPQNSNDPASNYGEQNLIATKVSEVLKELERLSASTMATSGLPKSGVVSFVCICGEINKRRPEFLQPDKPVYCINPDCREAWSVEIDSGSHRFKRAGFNLDCIKCGSENLVPWRRAVNLKHDEMLRFPCRECGETNTVWWHLMHGEIDLPTDGD